MSEAEVAGELSWALPSSRRLQPPLLPTCTMGMWSLWFMMVWVWPQSPHRSNHENISLLYFILKQIQSLLATPALHHCPRKVRGGIWGCVESLLDYSLSQPWPFRNSRFVQPFPLEPSVLSSSSHNKVEGLRCHSHRFPVDISSHSIHMVVCILLLLPIHGVTESLSQRHFPPFPCSKITSQLPLFPSDQELWGPGCPGLDDSGNQYDSLQPER